MSNLPQKANLSFYTHIYNEYSIEEYHLNNSLADYYDYLRNTKDLLNTTESFLHSCSISCYKKVICLGAPFGQSQLILY